MEEALRKLLDTFQNYDEFLIEEIYNRLKYENYQYNDFEELVVTVEEIIKREIEDDKDIKNDYEQYAVREKILAKYEKVTAYEVYRYIFPEDSLQIQWLR